MPTPETPFDLYGKYEFNHLDKFIRRFMGLYCARFIEREKAQIEFNDFFNDYLHPRVPCIMITNAQRVLVNPDSVPFGSFAVYRSLRRLINTIGPDVLPMKDTGFYDRGFNPAELTDQLFQFAQSPPSPKSRIPQPDPEGIDPAQLL